MDVAKLAGVSQSSVSRVYFEGAAVSVKTKTKVLAAAKELGYHPNEFARSLITNKTKIIGIVMKGVQNPFYAQVLKRFSSAFKKWGYSILFVYTNNDEIEKEDVISCQTHYLHLQQLQQEEEMVRFNPLMALLILTRQCLIALELKS